MTSKPAILPDSFSGSASWEQWILHFKDCATVNNWDADQKLNFLKVRLTGRAQTVFHGLTDTDKASFDAAVAALEAHFEPAGKRELYLADFSTRHRRTSESWIEYAEALSWLATKAYPDLDSKAHEQIALTQFLTSITDPQVILMVKQKNPSSLTEAATFTMQAECILASTRTVVSCPDSSSIPAQAVSREDKLLDLITKLSDKIDSISVQPRPTQFTARPRSFQPRPRPPQSPRRPVVCFRCHQEGHFARGCANPSSRPSQQGNEQPPAQ